MANRRPSPYHSDFRGKMHHLQQLAGDVATGPEAVGDPQYASYAEGVADVLAWLNGTTPTPALHDLLDLED